MPAERDSRRAGDNARGCGAAVPLGGVVGAVAQARSEPRTGRHSQARGRLARVLDWHIKRVAGEGKQPLANPLRMLPKHYSTYNEYERQKLDASEDKCVKVDHERDRRLEPGEYERIVAVLCGAKREDRERPLELPEGDALLDLFTLIVHTGLRLREAYSLRAEDVRLPERTLHVARSKTGKARDVPIVPAIFEMLARRGGSRHKDRRADTDFSMVVGRRRTRTKAGIDALKPSIRSRLRLCGLCGPSRARPATRGDMSLGAHARKKGSWMFRTEELMKITGHRNPVIFMRYVSLRGSDLAARLWQGESLGQSR